MNGSISDPLQPTWHGFIQNDADGLMLFEACLSGKLRSVPARLCGKERASLINSGNVFIYEENASGIKRWTDGVAWGPSRTVGNFLIYREVEKPVQSGEKKQIMKRKRLPEESEGRRDSEGNDDAAHAAISPTLLSPAAAVEPKTDSAGAQDHNKEMERQLIGRFADGYNFKPNGLVKKTMSIVFSGCQHHLVSYYTVEAVKQQRLNRPINDSYINNLPLRAGLITRQKFRAPVEGLGRYAVKAIDHAYPHTINSPMVAGSCSPCTELCTAPTYLMCSMASSGSVYAGLPAIAWPTAPQAI